MENIDPAGGFGPVLRRHRQAVQLTQEELADRAGLSVRAIADMESGRTARPYAHSVRRLIVALALTGKGAEDFRRASRGGPADSGSGPGPERRPAAPAGSKALPWRLPPAVGHFTGRAAEQAALDELLDAAGPAPVAIIGGPGIGKTALALHWADQRAGAFPDGQFLVDLRGFDPAAPPLTPAEALTCLLEELGVPARQVPASVEARAGLFRGLLAGRRALVIIDNARDSAHVRDLLPAGPGPLVLITSRNRLTGLVARDGARPLYLDVLTGADAVALMRARIGSAWAGSEQVAVARLADACARLPLALNIAAAILLTGPSVEIATLASELTAARGLDRLDAGDPASSARVVFASSYRLLSPAAARLFRLLGAAPGPQTSVAAAASLLATTPGRACDLIRELTEMHLLTERAAGRYGFHELLRSFAMDQPAPPDEPGERAAAVQRLLQWYLRTADSAARAINSRRRHASLDQPLPEVCPLAFAAYEPALAWLDAERANLVAAVGLAAEYGQHEIAWKLPVTLWDLFTLRGLFDDWIAAHRIGLASARELGEQFAQSWLLNNLSAAYLLQDRLAEAAEAIDAALPIFAQLGNTGGRASLLHNSGVVQLRQGRYELALRSLEAALDIYRGLENGDGEAQTHQSMGETYWRSGDQDRALACYELALAGFRAAGNRFSEGLALIDLARVHQASGQSAWALATVGRAVALSREVGHRPGEAEALALTGDLQDEAGQPAQARRSWRLAAAIFEELADPRAEELLARSQPASVRSIGSR